MYSAFSDFYDEFTDDVDYAAIADRYTDILAKHSAFPKEILDLGCGTGSLTLELASRGYDMTGVDISAEMLDKAFRKAQEIGDKKTLFINQGLTELDLYGSVDAVVSSLDVINHITDKRDLLKCFKLVSLFLVPNGLFVFDINTPRKFREEYGNNTYVFENNGDTCIWQNEFDTKRNICDFYLTFFKKQGDVYHRYTDMCSERMYTAEELSALLKKAGFETVGRYGEYSEKPKKTDGRMIIAARNRYGKQRSI